MGGSDYITLIFLGLAVFVIFKLRSVLGEQTGAEPPLDNQWSSNTREHQAQDGNVVSLPGRDPAIEPGAAESPAAFRWEGYASAGSAMAQQFDAIAALDRSFDPKTFVTGARSAYDMIVTAFNTGDRKTLKQLVSGTVFDSFSKLITERESRGETVHSRFVSIDRAEITQARVSGNNAEITVVFESQMITAIKDRQGNVVDGSIDAIAHVTDTWIFSRTMTNRDPNWWLVATGG